MPIRKCPAARAENAASPALLLRLAAMLAATLVCCRSLVGTAAGMVGGATAAVPPASKSVVMILGSGGTACTATVVARDLLLTAAHCVQPGADYKLADLSPGRPPALKDIAVIERHPQFDIRRLLGHLATADIALVKLPAPVQPKFVPAPLDASAVSVAVGDFMLVAGFGVSRRGDGRTGGTLRAARLVVTGQPGSLQVRLVDPRTRGNAPGLGACAGDSGAPAFRQHDSQLAVIGVVSWSTGPNLTGGCGGLTGITPLARYLPWIVTTARSLGSTLAEVEK